MRAGIAVLLEGLSPLEGLNECDRFDILCNPATVVAEYLPRQDRSFEHKVFMPPVVRLCKTGAYRSLSPLKSGQVIEVYMNLSNEWQLGPPPGNIYTRVRCFVAVQRG